MTEQCPCGAKLENECDCMVVFTSKPPRHHTAPSPLPLTFNQYQREAVATAIYPQEHAVSYPALGLAGEAGEIANKVKKTLRGDRADYDIAALVDELGDVLWYVSALASDLGVSLEDIAKSNLVKLQGRQIAATLQGDGDNR